MTNFDRAAAEFLRAATARANLTQAELSERCGINVVTLRRYLHGERSISLSDFRAIVSGLGIPVSDGWSEVERIYRGERVG